MRFLLPRKLPAALFAALFALLVGVLGAATHEVALAAPVPGFVEHWSSGTSGWGGGDSYANPGTGGQGGAGDGYLQLTTPGPSPFFTLNLGASSASVAYTGNWTAAGITHVKFWLTNPGAPRALEIHFALGSLENFWQYDTGFIPPSGSWAQFDVDLTTGPTGWTQIINQTVPPGTFATALQAVDKVLIRHDHAPYSQTPDTISATLGIDELSLVGAVGVPPPTRPSARAIALAAPWPNPSRNDITLAFESFDAAPVNIEIVDAAGRRVRRTVVAGAAGPHQWRWDGRTSSGAVATAGTYRARVYSSAGGASRPFTWLGGSRP